MTRAPLLAQKMFTNGVQAQTCLCILYVICVNTSAIFIFHEVFTWQVSNAQELKIRIADIPHNLLTVLEELLTGLLSHLYFGRPIEKVKIWYKKYSLCCVFGGNIRFGVDWVLKSGFYKITDVCLYECLYVEPELKRLYRFRQNFHHNVNLAVIDARERKCCKTNLFCPKILLSIPF